MLFSVPGAMHGGTVFQAGLYPEYPASIVFDDWEHWYWQIDEVWMCRTSSVGVVQTTEAVIEEVIRSGKLKSRVTGKSRTLDTDPLEGARWFVAFSTGSQIHSRSS